MVLMPCTFEPSYESPFKLMCLSNQPNISLTTLKPPQDVRCDGEWTGEKKSWFISSGFVQYTVHV